MALPTESVSFAIVAGDGTNAEIASILQAGEYDPHGPRDPNILYLPDVPKERDAAISYFLDAWSYLENELRTLLWVILGTDKNRSDVISANTQSTAQQMVLITSLGRLCLEPAEQEELERLVKRITAFNTKRNRIVHGSWHLHLQLRVEGGQHFVSGSEWRRQSTPTDPNLDRKLREGDRKTMAAWAFSIDRLNEVADHVVTLRGDISTFIGRIGGRLYPQAGLPAWE